MSSTDPAYKPGPGPRTAQYEEENTFSNPISLRFPALNWLTLGFGYHNAHHAKPMVPFYKLRQLHEAMYRGAPSPQTLTWSELYGTWLRNRHLRVTDESYGVVAKTGSDRAKAFVGSLGVSFFTV